MPPTVIIQILAAVLLALAGAATVGAADAPAAPVSQTLVIDVNKNPRIVKYQLNRLSNAELASVVRKPGDVKYKPVYETLLMRKGMEKKYREEAAGALARMDKDSPALEILNAIGAVDAEDKATQRELVSLLLAQKPADLASQKEKLASLAKDSDSQVVKQAAYAALATADGKPDEVWQLAAQSDGGLKALLGGLPWINDAKLREAFFPKVEPLVSKAPDPATQAAAAEAISAIPGHEAQEFKLLSQVIAAGKGEARDAAVRSIRRIPAAKWPRDQIPALAKVVLNIIRQTPANDRTAPAVLQTVQLGEDLAGAMPPARGVVIRRELRELAVRVVAIRTLREQMEYDIRYFVVQAGKPVEIILENDDFMPHNIVIGAPGSLAEIGAAAGMMQPPADMNEKAFIPNSPKVLHSTHLVQPDESATLSFIAPTTPGQYVFLCTFPGHWPKMYGTMLVVPDLEQWEANPKPPIDPFTKMPFTSQKNEAHPISPGEAGAEHQH
ncbi:MAG TPA: plastocyanin/azurin family copper-binding protein [Tepidisphaeraceae bacterium]|nr:plastocyanin/azurin family copper-binding protein [Tepidisphaeraceae bacterium]